MNGVSYDEYENDSAAINEAFLNTVAAVLGLFDSNGLPDVSGLKVLSVSPQTTVSSAFRTHLQTSFLDFNYEVQIVVGQGNDYVSPSEAYIESVEKLDKSVEDGTFTESLQNSGNSALSHATAYELPTVSEPDQEVIRPTSSTSTSRDELSDGAIAGITISVVICVLLGGILYYRIQQKKTFMKNLEEFRAQNTGDSINPIRSSAAHNEGATGQPSNSGADTATYSPFGAKDDVFTGNAGAGVDDGL